MTPDPTLIELLIASLFAFIAGGAASVLAYRLFWPLDRRTVRLVVAARDVAFGGYFDGGCEHQSALIRELDRASEEFAADVAWEEAE